MTETEATPIGEDLETIEQQLAEHEVICMPQTVVTCCTIEEQSAGSHSLLYSRFIPRRQIALK